VSMRREERRCRLFAFCLKSATTCAHEEGGKEVQTVCFLSQVGHHLCAWCKGGGGEGAEMT